MKKITIIAVSVVVIMAMAIGASSAMAAKPDGSNGSKDVIAKSNGFPSGQHFNLNIHGKTDFQCTSDEGGNSVFIPEYGDATITYVTNKKSTVTDLIAKDPCAFDDGKVIVQIPYEAKGYYVFAAIKGKPNNGAKDDSPSSIILKPNTVVQACDDPGYDQFGNLLECPDDDLMALGMIVGDNLYTAEDEQYVRFDPNVTKAKGRSKGTDITRLFTYTGWVIDDGFDTNQDGTIDEYDLPWGDYDNDPLTPDTQYDCNGDNSITEADVECWLTALWTAWQADSTLPRVEYFNEVWILNIADLVVTDQPVTNDGTKLLQIRFYPVDTTGFTPK
ncbi:hypothetical protein ACFLU3_03985 [Chloroflexota bacterium]